MDMFFFWLFQKHSLPMSFENGKVGALTHLMITYRGGYVKVHHIKWASKEILFHIACVRG